MSFEIIFATYLSIYPLVHKIQVVQPRYSAQDLGAPITIGEKLNFSVNFNKSPSDLVAPLPFNPKALSEENSLNSLMSVKLTKIEPKSRQIDLIAFNPTQSSSDLVKPLQFNLETWFEKNSPNSGMSVKLKEIESKFSHIDSVSTDTNVGSVNIDVGSVDIDVGSLKSELELDSQDLETEITLLSESGFRFKMKKELQNREREVKIGPVVSFKKSLNWFQEQSKTEPEENKAFLQQVTRFPVHRELTMNSVYLNSLRIHQGNEIDDSSKDIESLTKSLNSLTTSQFVTNTIFSLEGDLEDLSAKLEFPVPGILSDELELKIKTNLPEVWLDSEDSRDNIKSTLSLKYGIAIDDTIELEIQSSYDLQTTTTTHQIIFDLL